MENYKEIIEYAPIIIVILMFFWQNNVFVKPETLEKKHREILDNMDEKLEKTKQNFVELNAYKEFQSHVLNEISGIKKSITDNFSDFKEILLKRRKDD